MVHIYNYHLVMSRLNIYRIGVIIGTCRDHSMCIYDFNSNGDNLNLCSFFLAVEISYTNSP